MALEARYKAEKIGYPVIGEMAKENSDVVDYNINEEITVDRSSVFNANNDTTTGMATIIPGVNAPKLIENTSIYQNTESITGSAHLLFTNRLYRPDDNSGRIRTATITQLYGNIEFKNRTGNTPTDGVVIPVSGWYKLEVTYARGGSTRRVQTDVRTAKGYVGDETIATHVANYDNTKVTDTITYYFEAGTAIYVRNEYRRNDSSTGYASFDTEIVITKL